MRKTITTTKMVEKTIETPLYVCDECEQPVPDKSISIETARCRACNFELMNGINSVIDHVDYKPFHTSGIAKKPKKAGDPWIRGKNVLCGKWMHFCNHTCIAVYFEKLMAKK